MSGVIRAASPELVRLARALMITEENVLPPPAAIQSPPAPANHGAELKRGATTNAIAMLASNFRGVFTFLVARILGPAALGIFSVAWATTDLLCRAGMFALDNTVTTFIARAQTAGDFARSRKLFRLAVVLAVGQCTLLALVAIAVIRWLGPRFGLDPQIAAAVSVMLCAMPGLALYRINTAVSRGMKVMGHDIFSRGLTETIGTTAAFLLALGIGLTTFAPQIGALIGTAASGIVAFVLAWSLFRHAPQTSSALSWRREAKRMWRYAAPISAYDLLNAFIVRSDVIILGCFVGRAPGVTLQVVGIYGVVVEVAGGLRKVNQIFNPIFAPVVAGLTVHGEQARATAAFTRVAKWMLWILLPVVAVMALAGPLILGIYGSVFREGSTWLVIVAVACATNALVSLAETVIMVQKPRLNLLNSAITCVIALLANVWLIGRFGALGAAFGILLPYVVFGFLRYHTLRLVFRWRHPWIDLSPPFLAALIAGLPAFISYRLISGNRGEVISSLLFLAIFFFLWKRRRASEPHLEG